MKGAAGIDMDDVADLTPVDDWEDQVILTYCLLLLVMFLLHMMPYLLSTYCLFHLIYCSTRRTTTKTTVAEAGPAPLA